MLAALAGALNKPPKRAYKVHDFEKFPRSMGIVVIVLTIYSRCYRIL